MDRSKSNWSYIYEYGVDEDGRLSPEAYFGPNVYKILKENTNKLYSEEALNRCRKRLGVD